MSTAVTESDVRTRWPFLASTAFISDALLTVLIAEADGALNVQGRALLVRREEAVTHYAAHKAAITVAANESSNGMVVGPTSGESFLHRSVSRAVTASSSSSDRLSADLERTTPGQVLLTLLKATVETPRLYR